MDRYQTNTDAGCNICTIIPTYLLQHVADNEAAPQHVRACAARSIQHNRRLHGARQSHALQHSEAHQEAFHGIVPSYMHQAVLDNPDTTDEQKDRARKSLATSSSIRAAREGVAGPAAAPTARPRRLFRVIYDSGEQLRPSSLDGELTDHRAYG
jgi:hypothetical protein